jgi:hypothetical protein
MGRGPCREAFGHSGTAEATIDDVCGRYESNQKRNQGDDSIGRERHSGQMKVETTDGCNGSPKKSMTF